MAKVLEMPKLSPTMEEGQISAWHKKEGDAVAVDDLLAEVETDKATMEFRSFDKGTLLKILAPAGSVVKLGEPVAVVGNAGEDVSSFGGGGGDKPKAKSAKGDAKAPEKGETDKGTTPKADKTAKKAEAPAAEGAEDTGDAEGEAEAEAQADEAEAQADEAEAQADEAEAQADEAEAQADEPPASGTAKKTRPPARQGAARPRAAKADADHDDDDDEAAGAEPAEAEGPSSTAGSTGRVKASPYVRKLAREQDLDLRGVRGTGPNGRIVARDLSAPPAAGPKAATSARAPSAALAEPEKRPLSMMRKAIARRLTESKQTVPHFYLTIDIDADPLHALREQINADLAGATGDEAVKVSFNDLLIKAVAIALTRVPECNAQFTPEAILVHTRVDISVAVAVPDGLLTPVLRDADHKSVLEISSEVRDLATRAKGKKLKPEEMLNGTFSISNLGMFGIDEFSAVINPPEGAILAVGQLRREPVVRGDAVVPGRRLAMTLSCDHRVVDGAVGATFLKALRQLLEHPSQILLL
ncbi:MAG: dihydrolipoamide acetyltransferase family protein [Polyangiaceae bacterium]